jgi:hypothetical protein
VTRLWTDRHAIGATASRFCASATGTVDTEGGGFNPTLLMGGGAGLFALAAAYESGGSS